MGHERLGLLPKTRRWQEIVSDISDGDTSASKIAEITQKTLRNVHDRFLRIENDQGVQAAFQFLLNIALASKSANPHATLKELGLAIPQQTSLVDIVRALNIWIGDKQDSLEYGQLAKSATAETIAIWYKQNTKGQEKLFELSDPSLEVWDRTGSGAGFCELARLFLAIFTERYLKYFLDRTASAALSDIHRRRSFDSRLQQHIDEISLHAFETSKIMQSLAAGWFNKRARENIPSRHEVRSFLSLAFKKVAEELLREDGRQ
jgi:hypothetical protein